MTALAEALRDAGFQSAERLQEAAVKALLASPRNWDGAKDALYREIKGDAFLLWELFAPYRAQAAHRLLTDVAADMRRDEMLRRKPERGSGSGQWASDSRPAVARPASSITQMPRREPEHGGGTGQRAADYLTSTAQPAPSTAGMDAVLGVIRKSLLDTFRIEGVPVGDMTATAANAWADDRVVDLRKGLMDVRFVRLLTAGVPSGRPIRECRTAEQAQAAYERAMGAANE